MNKHRQVVYIVGFISLFVFAGVATFGVKRQSQSDPSLVISYSSNPGKNAFSASQNAQTDLNDFGLRISHASNSATFQALSTDESELMASESSDLPTGNVRLLDGPYNYPNPFNLAMGGTQIGFRLSHSASVELRLYDPFMNEIYRGAFPANVGTSYTTIALTSAHFGVTKLPSGVYYYLLMYENKVLGKGKMAVIP